METRTITGEPQDEDRQREFREPLLLAMARFALWIVSASLLVFVSLCYWRRFDACTVVTLFPTWCWAGIGLLLIGFSFSRRSWKTCLALGIAWIMYLVVFSDTPVSMLRAALPPPSGRTLRVVSFNCAGNSAAAREIAVLDPDVVLVQESPRPETLIGLARRMYGPGSHVQLGVDASILARGKVTPIDVPRELRGNFVHARVKVDSEVIDVISLRLYPCPVRLDLWSRDCWRNYEMNRATRRRQLSQIAAYIATLPAGARLIVGGDFNCPPRDAVLELLQPRLADSFVVAGRGWGATIIELFGWPTIRIDQIWTSGLFAVDAFTVHSKFSDHHMTVADFRTE